MPTYLISGDEDIRPSHINVSGRGRSVKHDTRVNLDASIELGQEEHYIVIAHGDDEGTVYWEHSNPKQRIKWLYVGMKNSPKKGVRAYLHSCCVGKSLPVAFRKCEIYAPLDVVPIPIEEDKAITLLFLRKVEQALEDLSIKSQKDWRKFLCDFVDSELIKAEKNNRFREFLSLMMLRKSLGFGNL